MNDDEWVRLQAKRERNAYFNSLTAAATESQRRPVRALATSVQKKISWKNPCILCGRDMRPGKHTIKEYPGTVAHYAHGMCRVCVGSGGFGKYPAAHLNGEPPAGRPERCITCKRKLRPNKTKIADYPDTVQYMGKGLCRSCAEGKRPSAIGRPISRPDNCVECGRPMRKKKSKLADHPGTVAYGGRGLCMSHWKVSQRKIKEKS